MIGHGFWRSPRQATINVSVMVENEQHAFLG